MKKSIQISIAVLLAFSTFSSCKKNAGKYATGNYIGTLIIEQDTLLNQKIIVTSEKRKEITISHSENLFEPFTRKMQKLSESGKNLRYISEGQSNASEYQVTTINDTLYFEKSSATISFQGRK